jgi:hypothetical protein
MISSKMQKNLSLKLKIFAGIIAVLVNLVIVLLIYWIIISPPESFRYDLSEGFRWIFATLTVLFGSGISYTPGLWDSLVADWRFYYCASTFNFGSRYSFLRLLSVG